VLFIAYDIDGISIDGEGRGPVHDGDGGGERGRGAHPAAAERAEGEPREMTEFVPLRGDKMPARAFVTVGLDQPAGAYTCRSSSPTARPRRAASWR
jgi:hypothetical protein